MLGGGLARWGLSAVGLRRRSQLTVHVLSAQLGGGGLRCGDFLLDLAQVRPLCALGWGSERLVHHLRWQMILFDHTEVAWFHAFCVFLVLAVDLSCQNLLLNICLHPQILICKVFNDLVDVSKRYSVASDGDELGDELPVIVLAIHQDLGCLLQEDGHLLDNANLHVSYHYVHPLRISLEFDVEDGTFATWSRASKLRGILQVKLDLGIEEADTATSFDGFEQSLKMLLVHLVPLNDLIVRVAAEAGGSTGADALHGTLLRLVEGKLQFSLGESGRLLQESQILIQDSRGVREIPHCCQ